MANLIAKGFISPPGKTESEEEKIFSKRPLERLTDPSAKVRAISAFALSDWDDSDSEGRLVALLKDSSAPVRAEALAALGNRTLLSPAATDEIAAALNDEDGLVRLHALTALQKGCAKERIEATAIRLVEFLDTHDTAEKLVTLSTLGALESDASEAALLKIVRDSKDPRFIDVAVEALTLQASSKAEESVLRALHEQRGSPEVMLTFIGEAGTERSLDTLIELINSDQEHLRELDISILTSRGGEHAREAMIKALESIEKPAGLRLNTVGFEEDPNVKTLNQLLESIDSLSTDPMSPPSRPETIASLLNSGKRHEKLIGMKRLQREAQFHLGIPLNSPVSPQADFLGPLANLAKDDSPTVRYLAMQALGCIIDPKAAPLLSLGWEDEVFAVRLQALKGITIHARSTGDAAEIRRLFEQRETLRPSTYDEADASLYLRQEIEVSLAKLTPAWVDFSRDRENLDPKFSSATRLLAAKRLSSESNSEGTSVLFGVLENGTPEEKKLCARRPGELRPPS